MKKTDKSFNYWQWRVILCSMISYAMFYFVRKNFSFAMPALSEEYGITNTSFGIILSLVGIIYGVSKLINGMIADRANARWHLVIGLSACTVINFIFGWSDKISTMITGQEGGEDFIGMMVVVMAVLLIANNIFQGCGAGPCQRLIVHWVQPKKLSTMTSIWNTSHSIGAGIVSVLCGYIIGTYGQWQLCFWIPATISAIGVFFTIITLCDTPSSVGLPELEGTKTEIDDDNSSEAFRGFVKKMVFKNPIIWAVASISLMVYIVRFAVLDWGPTFLMNRANPLSPEMAGWTIAIFEMAGCAGMVIAGWASDRFFDGKAQRVCLIELVIVAILLLVLQFLPEDSSPILLLVLLALAGFFMYGPQTLVGVVAFKHATKKASATAIGFIGLTSYASVLFTGVGLGWYSDHFGWDTLFLLMAGVSVIGSIIAAFLWNLKDDAYIHEK